MIFNMWLAAEEGKLDTGRELLNVDPWFALHNLVHFWLPLDVALTGDTSRTLDEIESPTDSNTLLWVQKLPVRDRWISNHGMPVFKEAFAMLRKEPRYQAALRKYGVDDESLARIQVHTEGLWK